MVRKQDKGGPFFWSRLESLANSWPIAIRVGQDGPRIPARHLRSTGRAADIRWAVQLQGRLARERRESFGTELRRDRPSARATQRARQISAPSECSSATENSPRTPRHGRLGGQMRRMRSAAQPAPLRQRWAPARGTRIPHLLTEGSSAATRTLRRIPENPRRLLRIPPSFILLSQPPLPTSRSHLSDSSSRPAPGQPSAFRPATMHHGFCAPRRARGSDDLASAELQTLCRSGCSRSAARASISLPRCLPWTCRDAAARGQETTRYSTSMTLPWGAPWNDRAA